MVPDLSRRQFVGGVGLGAAGIAGATTRIGVGSLDTWTPDADTWPHDRYGLRNAAANPRANPPDDPAVAWRARPVENVQSLVVGPDRVYVGAEFPEDGPGVAALDRTSGEVLWTAAADGATLALRRGTLYAATDRTGSTGVTAFDVADGEKRWREPVGDVEGVVVADGTVFAESHYRLTALDAESGRTRWTGDGGLPAVADGALLVSGGGVRRHRPRRVSDVLTGGPPPVAWDARGGGALRPPVVGNDCGCAVVGQGLSPHAPKPSVYAFDLETGAREWTAATPPEDSFPVLTGSPAVGHGRGFFSYRERTGDDRYHALVACSLDDGAERWRWESSDWVTSVAIGGETVLAGTAADPDTPGDGRNRLLAFTLDGDRRWSFETDRDVRALAAVDGTVFVGTDPAADADGGAVYAFR